MDIPDFPTRAAVKALGRLGSLAIVCAGLALHPSPSRAQWEEESSVSLHAMMKLQAGMFVPMLSSRFKPHENEAYIVESSVPFDRETARPCDPVVTPRQPCRPFDHGKEPGSASMARATLQLEGHWDFTRWAALHTIVRTVRSGRLPKADEYARPPRLLLREPGETDAQLSERRRQFGVNYAHENYYNEVDLREFYLDLWPTDWLAFRIGRQQLAWGETGSFRLLDVVNPTDTTWHFGALESFEDQRIPQWMWLTQFEIPQLRSSLEAIWLPGLDRARFTVNPPLSFVGAWGIPYSNVPARFESRRLDFRYPGGEFAKENMRGGARLKGVLGDNGGYSLVYMYTHMMRPVLTRVQLAPLTDSMGNPIDGVYDNTISQRTTLEYPRKHVVGGSFEWTVPSPLAATFRMETAIETNRAFSPDPTESGNLDNSTGVITYPLSRKPVVNYALVFQRPTMIRWLNPVQNFLLVAQFMHTAIPTDPVEDDGLVQVISYNDWAIQKHSYLVVAHARTTYAHGLFEPRLTGVWMRNPYYADSGFVTLDLRFRVGPHYRMNLQLTDFIGGNAYRDLGLFRDRDEINASFTVLF